jgi:hypothetical protein
MSKPVCFGSSVSLCFVYFLNLVSTQFFSQRPKSYLLVASYQVGMMLLVYEIFSDATQTILFAQAKTLL